MPAQRVGIMTVLPCVMPNMSTLDPGKWLEPLQSHVQALQASTSPYVRIKHKVDPTALWDSKYAGKPYLPLSETYPVDQDGRPLVPEVQINFADVPALAGFPTKGIMTVYDLSTGALQLRLFSGLLSDCPAKVGRLQGFTLVQAWLASALAQVAGTISCIDGLQIA